MRRPHAEPTPDEEPSLGRDLPGFGSILDRVIRNLEGDATAEVIDASRRASSEHQAHASRIAAGTRAPSDEPNRLSSLLSGRDAIESEILCRAFLCHLHLIELTEAAQSLLEDGAKATADVWHSARQMSVDGDRRAEILDAWAVESVLTVHPCRVSSVTHLRLDQEILKLAAQPPGEDRDERALGLITDLWRSTPYVTTRPTTREQREHLLFMMTESIYGACPEVVDRVSRIYDDLRASTGTSNDSRQPEASRLPDIDWATWVGGDMDANPYVTADTLKSSLAFHREAVLSLYSRDLGRLADQIATERSGLPDPDDVLTRVQTMTERLDGTRSASHRGRRSAPATSPVDSPGAGPYRHPAELSQDLVAVGRILEQAMPDAPPTRAARRLERRIGMFGFHLVRLNQRQDSALHRDVIGQLMIDDRWAERPSSSRIRRLRQMIPKAKRRSTPAGSPAFVHQSLAVFRALEDARKRGIQDRASGPFVISLAEGPDDLLSVLLLARWGGLIVDGQVPLDIAPLFETVEDLQRGPQILDELLGLEVYRRHLAARQNRQIVMLSMADLNKDSGFLSASHYLVDAQRAMAEAVSKHEGLELIFLFDRPDPLWRYAGIHAGAREGLSPRLAVTEPGTTLSNRFLLPELVGQTVEGSLAISLDRAAPGTNPEAELAEGPQSSSSEIIATAAQGAMEKYRDLVYGERKLYRYYRLATPVDVIERLMIGSRSSSRRTHAGVANVRPTPWELAWALSRHGLPGWFGLGSGLQRSIDVHGATSVSEAASSCPILSQLLRRAEMTLAWTDLEIAERFSGLAGELGSKIFPRIAQEHVLTLEILRELHGETVFAVDMRGMERRRPYVDSISRLQLDLLQRWREGSREDDRLLKALLASVGGAFQGLKPIL